jgi:hypothetical protein
MRWQMSESDTQRAVTRFNELGAETIRQLLDTDALPQGWRLIAMRWLESQPTSAEREPAREPKHRR